MPDGGVTATQPVTTPQVPATIEQLVEQLTPVQQRFRRVSTPMSILLQQQSFTSNNLSQSARISSVGLGFRTVTHWHIVLDVKNAGAGAETIAVNPYFPYNLISRTQVQVNGGATVYNVGGVGSLMSVARKRRNLLLKTVLGNANGQQNVPFGLCDVVVANGTVTNVAANLFSLSGIASVSIAAGATATFTCDFYTYERLTLNEDNLLGALPLQNSATFATITYNLVNSYINAGANIGVLPFYNAGADVTCTVDSASTVQSLYEFWSVPPDPGLYNDMVVNSFQIQQNDGIAIASNGAGAFAYNIPQNMLLVAAHVANIADANKYLLGGNVFNPLQVQYNGGSVIAVQMPSGLWQARQILDYGNDMAVLPGYALWDGEATSESITETDDAGWLDAYHASEPQLVGTVVGALDSGGAPTYPLTASVIREQVVAGAVSVV